MSGTIQKHDIISPEALKVFKEIVLEYQRLLKETQQLKANLPNAGFKEAAKNAELAKKKIAELEAINKKLAATIKQNKTVVTQMATGATKATKGFDRLGFSIQQVARELPSAAYGATIFFGAISNNLPIMADEIARARKEYQALTKAGKQATPVWKQIIKSIFSWQTAMVAAVTVLTLYGKEIIDWMSKLIKGKKALDATKISQEALTKAQENANGAISRQTTKMEILYRATQDVNESMEDRKAAVEELQRMYPEYLGNLKSEDILAGNAATAYENLKNSIIEKAKAQAFADKIAENSAKILDQEVQLLKAQDKQTKAAEHLVKTRERLAQFDVMDESDLVMLGRAEKAYRDASEEVDGIITTITGLADANANLEDQIDVSDWVTNFTKATKDAKKGSNKFYHDAEGLLARLQDAYDAHYEERLSLARNDFEETKAIQIQMIRESLNNDTLTLLQRQQLYTKLREISDEYIQWQTDNELSAIYERANILRVAEAERANEEFQNSAKTQKDKIAIVGKSTIKMLQIEYDAALEAQSLYEIGTNEWKIQEERKNQLKEKLAQEGLNITKKYNAEELKEFEQNVRSIQDLMNAGFEFGAALNERAVQNNERRFELETQAAGDNKFKQLAAERKFEKEAAKLKKKQAIADKAAAASNVILNTAVAVSKVLGQTGIFGISLVPIVAALGALQLATVLAQPIPQFAEGVENFGGGLAVVGDKKGDKSLTKSGGSELLLFPGGKSALSPSSPTVMDLPAGTSVIPHDETTQMLATQAMRSSHSMVDMSSTNNHLKDIKKNTGESVVYDGRYKIVTKPGFKGRYRI